MDIAGETGDRDPHVQLLFEVLRITVNEVIRALIAFVDQRVMHLDRLDSRLTFAQAGDVGVIEP
jgi:hypothetical protein